MIASIEKELRLLSNKARYIQGTLQGEIDLRGMKKGDILDMMNEQKYTIIDDDNDFKYLLKMPMDSVSEENVERVLKDKLCKETELTIIKSTTIENMWLNELEELKQMLANVENKRIKSTTTTTTTTKSKTTVIKKVKKVVKK